LEGESERDREAVIHARREKKITPLSSPQKEECFEGEKKAKIPAGLRPLTITVK
jgi:hypothetical protein